MFHVKLKKKKLLQQNFNADDDDSIKITSQQLDSNDRGNVRINSPTPGFYFDIFLKFLLSWTNKFYKIAARQKRHLMGSCSIDKAI